MTDLFEQSDHRLKGAIEVAQGIAGSILSKKSLFAIMEQLHMHIGNGPGRSASYDLLRQAGASSFGAFGPCSKMCLRCRNWSSSHHRSKQIRSAQQFSTPVIWRRSP